MTAEVSNVNWADLAIGLYEKLDERNAQINYSFQDLQVEVPSGAGKNAERALWVANGTLKISTSGAQ